MVLDHGAQLAPVEAAGQKLPLFAHRLFLRKHIQPRPRHDSFIERPQQGVGADQLAPGGIDENEALNASIIARYQADTPVDTGYSQLIEVFHHAAATALLGVACVEGPWIPSSRVRLSSRALTATRAELPDMASAATSGLITMGYNTPAARGKAMTL